MVAGLGTSNILSAAPWPLLPLARLQQVITVPSGRGNLPLIRARILKPCSFRARRQRGCLSSRAKPEPQPSGTCAVSSQRISSFVLFGYFCPFRNLYISSVSRAFARNYKSIFKSSFDGKVHSCSLYVFGHGCLVYL